MGKKPEEKIANRGDLDILAKAQKSGSEIGAEYYNSLVGAKVASTPKLVIQRFMDGARSHIIKAHMQELASGEKSLQQVGETLLGDPLFDFVENKTKEQRELSSRFISSNLPKLVEEAIMKKYVSDAKKSMDDIAIAQEKIKAIMVKNIEELRLNVQEDPELDFDIPADLSVQEIGDREASMLAKAFVRSTAKRIRTQFDYDPDKFVAEMDKAKQEIIKLDEETYRDIRSGKSGDRLYSAIAEISEMQHPKKQEMISGLEALGSSKRETLQLKSSGFDFAKQQIEQQIQLLNSQQSTEGLAVEIASLNEQIKQARVNIETQKVKAKTELTNLLESSMDVFNPQVSTEDMIQSINIKKQELGVAEGKEDMSITKDIANFFVTGNKTSRIKSISAGELGKLKTQIEDIGVNTLSAPLEEIFESIKLIKTDSVDARNAILKRMEDTLEGKEVGSVKSINEILGKMSTFGLSAEDIDTQEIDKYVNRNTRELDIAIRDKVDEMKVKTVVLQGLEKGLSYSQMSEAIIEDVKNEYSSEEKAVANKLDELDKAISTQQENFEKKVNSIIGKYNVRENELRDISRKEGWLQAYCTLVH